MSSVYADDQIEKIKNIGFVRNTLFFLCDKSFNVHLRIWDTGIEVHILLRGLWDFTLKFLNLYWNNIKASKII